MAKKSNTRQKKKNGASVQELLGIKAFTEYGIQTNRGELLFQSETDEYLGSVAAERGNEDTAAHLSPFCRAGRGNLLHGFGGML